MAREENVKIFQDTERLVKEVPALKEAVKNSAKRQLLIPEAGDVAAFLPDLKQNRKRFTEDAKITVSKKRTYEAAAGYSGEKVCVLNFASATNPGGGVVKGSSAQEECLCHCSTLYFNRILYAPQERPGSAAQRRLHLHAGSGGDEDGYRVTQAHAGKRLVQSQRDHLRCP